MVAVEIVCPEVQAIGRLRSDGDGIHGIREVVQHTAGNDQIEARGTSEQREKVTELEARAHRENFLGNEAPEEGTSVASTPSTSAPACSRA